MNLHKSRIFHLVLIATIFLCDNKGPFTCTFSVSIRFYHVANDDGLFDGQNRSGTHSVRKCKFDYGGDGDGDGDGYGMCKRIFKLS